jgi:CubicO group peptidase (beta-lactamase class C family)
MLLATGCGNDKPQPPPNEDTIPARFRPLADAIEQERISLGVPGVAVAVVEHGELTFAHRFGSKNPKKSDPVKPTTLFRIGSITKSLTAIAVLQRVQQGQVRLDGPLVQYVPEFHLNLTPASVPSITVRHLLTHTSGLFDYIEFDAPANERTDAALEGFLTGRFSDIGYT